MTRGERNAAGLEDEFVFRQLAGIMLDDRKHEEQ
jgi:hypothetical protein